MCIHISSDTETFVVFLFDYPIIVVKFGFLKFDRVYYYKSGLAPDILKMEFWTHMGRTANIIIKDIIHIFASMCKNMRILVMGRRYRERCKLTV